MKTSESLGIVYVSILNIFGCSECNKFEIVVQNFQSSVTCGDKSKVVAV